MRHRALAVTQWTCTPFDKDGKQVALSDPAADYVALEFGVTVDLSSEVGSSIGDASGGTISISCDNKEEADPESDVDGIPGEPEEDEDGEGEEGAGGISPGEGAGEDVDPDV